MQGAEIAYQNLGTPSVCGTSLDKLLQVICSQNQMEDPYKIRMITDDYDYVPTVKILTPKNKLYHSPSTDSIQHCLGCINYNIILSSSFEDSLKSRKLHSDCCPP